MSRGVLSSRAARPKFGLIALAGCAAIVFGSAPALAGKLPPFEQIRYLVDQHFAAKIDFQPGDLISQADVEPIFTAIAALGIKPADSEAVYDAFLREQDFLVQVLRQPAGQAFMRKVSKLPKIYDRLDRLSWFPEGMELLHEMIRHPDGVKSAQYLCTTAGVREIERRFAGQDRAKNMSLPSGRIHTKEQLLEHLRQIHKRADTREAK